MHKPIFLDWKLKCHFRKTKNQLLAANSKIPNKNYHIDINMRTKKLYFVERYNGQFIKKNSIFK